MNNIKKIIFLFLLVYSPTSTTAQNFEDVIEEVRHCVETPAPLACIYALQEHYGEILETTYNWRLEEYPSVSGEDTMLSVRVTSRDTNFCDPNVENVNVLGINCDNENTLVYVLADGCDFSNDGQRKQVIFRLDTETDLNIPMQTKGDLLAWTGYSEETNMMINELSKSSLMTLEFVANDGSPQIITFDTSGLREISAPLAAACNW